ncbi:MAG: ABC transporter permease [Rhodospirillaceae bacterium]|nr:ABC transporter permease [Rhodospirillaceae bacterium]MBT6203049.1 ABC transporter permease [Rhodospirillaceae bacterium]MBT6510933.1 ABC transporter permease [Rhodospirillaceae bacterium]MBT7612989.1 ABC transporter permease [Rhodospirillaceae bacterium]MBT7645840.1 ABC transporter permease [Rhodospirillaceae bacterium]
MIRAAKMVFLTVVFGMMAAPLLIVAGVSLNAKKRMFFPPDGISLRWFPEVFTTAKWLEAVTNSVFIAIAAAFIAVSIALPIAYFLWRYRVFYAKALFIAGLVPFALPPVITALGMLVFWSEIGFVGTIWNIMLGHGVFLVTLPLVMISLGLESIDEEILEAGRTMGANSRKLFTSVVFPMVLPYMIAGYAFVLVLSMNEYIIAFFLGQHATLTLPVQILSSLRSGYTPVIAAVAVMFMILAIAIFGLIARFGDLPKLLGAWAPKE